MKRYTVYVDGSAISYHNNETMAILEAESYAELAADTNECIEVHVWDAELCEDAWYFAI